MHELTAISFSELDDYVYIGTKTGTKEELLAAISDASNWDGSDSQLPSLNVSDAFTVLPSSTPAVPEPCSIVLASIGIAGARRLQRNKK